MIRFLVLELIVPLLLIFFVRALLRSLFASFQSRSPQKRTPQAPPPTTSVGGELKKDPVCGTYVAATPGLTRTINGDVLHFCSRECRDKYRVA
jgi:YHS domain-containing protein